MAKRTLSRDGHASLAERVSAWLVDAIVTGTLAPGASISENELATRLGVSRSPVREALRGLARDGVVDVRPQRGTFVAEFSVEETEDLYYARELIEPEMARLAIENSSDADLVRIADIVGDLHRAHGDPRAHYDSIHELWQLLTDRCPNRTLSDLSTTLWRRSMWFRGVLLAQPEAWEHADHFGQTFAGFATKRDADGAKRAMAEFFSHTRKILLSRLRDELGDDLGRNDTTRELSI
jgi:DNA-binding GntR family transcriptional regulator